MIKWGRWRRGMGGVYFCGIVILVTCSLVGILLIWAGAYAIVIVMIVRFAMEAERRAK